VSSSSDPIARSLALISNQWPSQLFFDDDGKVYLSTTFKTPFNGDPFEYMAVYASEIDLDTGRNLTRPVLLRKPLPGVISAEGSHIVKKDGWYYLFTADNGTFDGHQEWVSRSRSPLGPYEPGDHNPIVFNDQDMHVRATGHMDVVQDTEGGWWGVMLAVRPQIGPDGKLRGSQLGRETFLVPIEWPTGGWPVLNDNKPVSTKGLTLGRSMADQRLQREWRDDFDKGMTAPRLTGWRDSPDFMYFSHTDTLSLGWYHIRTPLKQDWSLTHRTGWLTLFGSPYTIDKQECPTVLFRKQTAFSGTWITELDFCPSQHGDEAGTTVYYSMYAFMAIGIRKSDHPEVGRYVFLRWVDPDTSERKVSPCLSGGHERKRLLIILAGKAP
jgi:beta-xylosidase